MRYIFTTLTLTLFVFCAANAQYFKGKESYNQLVKKAEVAYANGDQLYALEYARRAAKMDTSSLDLWYMVGETATNLTIIDEAKTAYLMAAAHDERARYPMIDFHLGNTHKVFGEYEEAIQSYQRFLQEYEGSDKANPSTISTTKRYIQDSQVAMNIEGQSKGSGISSVKRVDRKFNAACRSTFAPYLYEDELYFTSLYYPSEVDTTDLKNAKFNIFKQNVNRPSSKLDQVGNEAGKSGHFALSLDKGHMYYTICDYQTLGKYRCEIYRSKKNSNGSWSPGERLPDGINLSNYNTTQPAIGEDAAGNEILFFASNRPDASGAKDMDIWQSRIELLADGRVEYQDPENLTAINTDGNDVTPFYHQKCETLYFSTDGRPSLGNLDIYQAKRNGNTWETPRAMDYPVNSSFDDNYFFRSEEGTRAYFASNRVTSEDLEMQPCKGCCPSIYETKIEDITASLEVLAYCGTEQLDDISYTINSGEFRNKLVAYNEPINLKPNTDYELEIQKTDYTSTSFEINIAALCDSAALQERVYIQPKNNLTLEIFGQSRLGKSRLDRVDRVRILGETDRIDEIKEAVTGGETSFSIKPEATYKIVVEKEGYKSDSLTITTLEEASFCTLNESITLIKDEELPVVPKITGKSKIPEIARTLLIPELPRPVKLYFHNAIPSIEKRDLGEVDIAYDVTYKDYIELINQYKLEMEAYYKQRGNTTRSELAASDAQSFFSNKVEQGFEILKLYASTLDLYMQKNPNERLQICIQGMASPLASTNYNKYLSERRINSVRNFLRTYKNGTLAPFIGTSITIKELPLGEAKGTPEMEGKVFGIYAPESAILRNVTIIDIQEQGAEGCEPIEN